MLKISLKLGIVMNLEFSKKFVLVSLGAAAIWGGVTYGLLQTGLSEANPIGNEDNQNEQ